MPKNEALKHSNYFNNLDQGRAEYFRTWAREHQEERKEYQKNYHREYRAVRKLLREQELFNLWLKETGRESEPSASYAHTHNIYLKEKNKKKRKAKKRKQQFIKLNPIEKMTDNPFLRIKTRNKRPKRKDWPNWYEKLSIETLKTKNGEAGVRTGKPVLYRGRKYFLYLLDEDFNKPKKDLPATTRLLIDTISRQRNEKWGVSYTNTTNGRHTIILSKEELPDLDITWGRLRPTDFLGRGRQFIIAGPGKEYINRNKLKIVKNFLGLKRVLKSSIYTIKEKVKEIIKEKEATNIKVYQPLKSEQIIRRPIRQEVKPSETFTIKEKLLNIEAISKMGIMDQPHRITTDSRIFYADYYFGNQQVLNKLINTTPTLELKQGYKHQFFNRIWTTTA